jgi:hypothetical protein
MANTTVVSPRIRPKMLIPPNLINRNSIKPIRSSRSQNFTIKPVFVFLAVAAVGSWSGSRVLKKISISRYAAQKLAIDMTPPTSTPQAKDHELITHAPNTRAVRYSQLITSILFRDSLSSTAIFPARPCPAPFPCCSSREYRTDS